MDFCLLFILSDTLSKNNIMFDLKTAYWKTKQLNLYSTSIPNHKYHNYMKK